ncbi:hypothetical protein C8J57DRAFT_1355870 [Mycena rebaudengoi]|nr:hypothetical protein C8J57DRAFT_1355870 [Mycena rebaudengoi]
MPPSSALFGIQELVDHIVDLLHASTTDLKVCALVGRRWVCAAQLHLFTDINLGGDGRPGLGLARNERRSSRFVEAIKQSPRLAASVRTLHTPETLSRDTFLALAQFPYPRLQHVSVVYATDLSDQIACGFQRLLSLPTVRSVELTCQFKDPLLFVHIWERCSPLVTNLQLHLPQTYLTGSSWSALSPVDRRMKLDSFSVSQAHHVFPWLCDPNCPFDFSQLTSLGIGHLTAIVRERNFIPALAVLKCLDFIADRA